MRVELTELLTCVNRQAEKRVEIELQSFQSKLGEFPIIEKAPFELHLENQENKQLLIFGDTEVVLSIPCARCVKDVEVRIPLSIERKYLIGIPSEDDEEEAEYITGSSLDVDELVYDEILVNWPMRVLCREDCKGICRKCGTDLNNKTCSCEKTELDPRMAAIQDIFNQFKEV